MKATGIIRRIDELGRIVIPKEIRKSLRITEGENLEIFVDNNDSIILKKFSFVKKMEDLAHEYVESIFNLTKGTVLVSDNNLIVSAVGNNKKEYLNRLLSESIKFALPQFQVGVKINEKIIADKAETKIFISNILVHGDIAGYMFLIDPELEESYCRKIIEVATSFLGKYLEPK